MINNLFCDIICIGGFMKKLVRLLIILTVLYFGIEISFVNLNKGHKLEYKIKSNKKVFTIKEVYTQRKKNEKNNYYFEIKVDDNVFNYQTYNNYKRANYIIKKIDYFENDDYKCINIKDKKNKSISDVLCLKDNIEYNYNSIKGKNKELDKFVSKLKEYKKYTDNKKDKIKASPVTLYTDNLVNKHYIGLQNYKGIYLINKKDKVKNVSMFKADKYTNEASIISNDWYISADCNREYKFHEFYLVNIRTGKKRKITSDREIAVNSYMQGAVDKEVYLFDKSNKLQYRINLKNNTVKISGRTSEGIELYEDSEYTLGSAYDAFSEKVIFNKYTSNTKFDGKKYARVDKVGNKLSGYYYVYVKDDDNYKAYKVNVQNKKILTYLFTTTNIENIYYHDDYVYYKDGKYIKYYQNDTGIKTLLKDNEFEFNKSLKFGLYVK